MIRWHFPRYPCSSSHSLCHLFRSVCASQFWYCDPLSAQGATPCSDTPRLPPSILSCDSQRELSRRGQLTWDGLHIGSQSVPLSASITFSPCLLFILWQLHSNSTTRDAEQSTKGVFSGPLRGPLPLLGDLYPNLEYMFAHRHACTTCWLQPIYSLSKFFCFLIMQHNWEA